MTRELVPRSTRPSNDRRSGNWFSGHGFQISVQFKTVRPYRIIDGWQAAVLPDKNGKINSELKTSKVTKYIKSLKII